MQEIRLKHSKARCPSGAYLNLTGKIRLKHSSLVFIVKLRFGFPAEDSGLRLPNLVLRTDGTATEKHGGRRRRSLRVNIFLSWNCLLCRKKKLIKIHKGTAARLNYCYKELKMF